MNIQDRWGTRALLVTVFEGSVQCVELLLKAGADVNIEDKQSVCLCVNNVNNV